MPPVPIFEGSMSLKETTFPPISSANGFSSSDSSCNGTASYLHVSVSMNIKMAFCLVIYKNVSDVIDVTMDKFQLQKLLMLSFLYICNFVNILSLCSYYFRFVLLNLQFLGQRHSMDTAL